MATGSRPTNPPHPPITRPWRSLRTAGRDRESAVGDMFNWRPNELVVGAPRASRKAQEPGNA
jgi:hypothetical protein